MNENPCGLTAGVIESNQNKLKLFVKNNARTPN